MRRQKRAPVGLILALAGAGFLVLAAGAVVVLALSMPTKPTTSSMPTTPADVMTREAFKAAVMGKTPDEIIAAVGRPDSAKDDDEGKAWYWRYYAKVLNPTTGKPSDATVYFEDGRAVDIEWGI